MPEATEPTGNPTAPAASTKRPRGRPRIHPKPNEDLLRAQAQEIDELRNRLAQALAEKQEKVADSPKLQPGEVMQVGQDPGKQPIYSKVRWTRRDLEKKYPPVTFAPERSMIVAPHGVRYELVVGRTITVPAAVKEVHDDITYRERQQQFIYRPWTGAELDELNRRAYEQPGQWHPSRVAKLGVGFPKQQPAPTPEE